MNRPCREGERVGGLAAEVKCGGGGLLRKEGRLRVPGCGPSRAFWAAAGVPKLTRRLAASRTGNSAAQAAVAAAAAALSCGLLPRIEKARKGRDVCWFRAARDNFAGRLAQHAHVSMTSRHTALMQSAAHLCAAASLTPCSLGCEREAESFRILLGADLCRLPFGWHARAGAWTSTLSSLGDRPPCCPLASRRDWQASIIVRCECGSACVLSGRVKGLPERTEFCSSSRSETA